MSDSFAQPEKRSLSAFIKTDGFAMLCLYAAAFIIHFLMTLNTTIFNLTPDEFSVTAVAALANGYDWSGVVSLGGYYGYFQSLFYIPVFGMTDDPYLRYRLMLVINGALMSLIPVIVYYIAAKKLDVKKPAAILFAAVCGLYPCYMLLTKYTWNETMCDLLPWVFMLLIFVSMDCTGKVKKQVISALAGLTLAAAYASHGRMLSLLAAGAVLVPVIYFAMRKKRVFCFSGFYAALAVGVAGDTMMKKMLQKVLWRAGEDSTPSNTLERMLSKLLVSDESGVSAGSNVSIERFFETLTGHFFYFISSTWGFGAICVVMIITAIVLCIKHMDSKPEFDETGALIKPKSPYADDKLAVMCWYVFLAMGAVFAVSVLFKSTSNLLYERMDTVMYGRYTEAFYPLAIFAALTLIYKGCLSAKQILASLLVGAGINILAVMTVVPVVLGCDRFVSAMIIGLAPLRYGEELKSLFTQESFLKIIITTMSVLFAWLAVKYFRKKNDKEYLFFALPLAALLLYSGIYGYVSYTVPQAKNAAKGATYMSQAMELVKDDCTSAALVGISRDRQTKAQFIYPDIEMSVITKVKNVAKEETLPEVVLAGREDLLPLWSDKLYLVGDINSTVHAYVSTEEAAQRARDKGMKVGERGAVHYTAAEIPATESVIKQGLSADADLNYADSCENVTAIMPQNAGIYTNYFNIDSTSRLFITVEGSGVDKGKITLTSAKGAESIKYDILSTSNDKLAISFVCNGGTEDIRFKLTNTDTEPMEITALEITRAS